MSASVTAGGLWVGRVLAAAVLAVVMVATPQVGVASSGIPASTAPVAGSFRLTPVAGTAHYLIYTKLGAQAGGDSTPTGGLFVMTSNGVSRRLTTITTNDINFSLAGKSLIYEEGSTGTVHWWNIVTGAHRQFVYHDDPSIDQRLGPVGAAPHGVLVGEADSTHPHNMILEVDRFHGTLHPFGDPFPHRRFYGITEGNARVVVSDLNNGNHDGVVKLLTFTNPGHARTLAGSGIGAHLCPSVTHDYVACQVSPNENGPKFNSMHLLSTDGRHHASTTKGCASQYAAVLGDSAAWIVSIDDSCPAYHLWTLNINGTVRKSTRTYAALAPIAAFHQIVVATRSQHSLDELNSATAKPHVLVHVK